jgi:hypothetical protein
MRAFLRGLLAGLMLSCLRAVVGLDLLEWGAVSARTSYGWRAAALFAVGLALWIARQGSLSARVLLGTTVGFAVHGLLLANARAPSSTFGLVCTALVGIVLIVGIRNDSDDVNADRDPASFLEMLGLAAAAAGAAISLEGVARHVRLYGAGLAQDDTVFASTGLVLLTLAVAALGWIARKKALRGFALPIALAASTTACLLSLNFVVHLATTPQLAAYLNHFRLDTSLHGTVPYDAVIAGAAFVAPGLLLGAGLGAARGRSRIFSLLVGSATGLLFIPGLLAQDPGATLTDVQPSSAELIPLGSLIASGGAILAIVSLTDRGMFARWISIAVAVGLGVPGFLRDVEPVHVLSPWTRRPIFPSFLADTPEGLVSVDSYGILGGSWLWVTLDRRRVTPELEGAVADAMRLRASLDFLPPLRQAAGKIRMLLVGQLTPERARILMDAGVGSVDRTAVWWASMPRIEETLWSAVPNRPAAPAGEVITPSEARDRIARDDYDLVVAMPVPGDAPHRGTLHVPDTTTVVRWFDLDEPVAHRELGDSVALVMDGLERPALALVENAGPIHEDPFAPLVVRVGPSCGAPAPLTWLQTRHPDNADERTPASRSAMMARIAETEKGGPLEDLTAGFALFYAARIPSAPSGGPTDKPANQTPPQVELPDACLAHFRAAALARTPDPTIRRTWEALAKVLVGQHSIEKIYTYLEPVAEKHGPWPALDEALAKADLESQRPQDALRRLEPLKTSAPEDFEVWFLLGEARCAVGDRAGALESWRTAVKLRTSDVASKRRVAVALARAGDEEGREAARKLLAESPNDKELRDLLDQPSGPGPAPSDPCDH